MPPLLRLNKVCCTCSNDTCSLLHACVSPAAMCSCIGVHALRGQGPTRNSRESKHMGPVCSYCEATAVDRCPSGAWPCMGQRSNLHVTAQCLASTNASEVEALHLSYTDEMQNVPQRRKSNFESRVSAPRSSFVPWWTMTGQCNDLN